MSNAGGVVRTLALDLANPSHEVAFDRTGLALSAYRIQASGTCNGVSVIAPDSYFGVFDGSLVPFPQEISTLPNALFLIGKNVDGTPSAKALPAPTGGAPGRFLQNLNGVAIWQVDGSSIPQPEYTWLGRRLYVPLPFSPVFILDNP